RGDGLFRLSFIGNRLPTPFSPVGSRPRFPLPFPLGRLCGFARPVPVAYACAAGRVWLPHRPRFPGQRGGEAMRALGQFAAEFLRREDGTTAAEYAIVGSLVAAFIIGHAGQVATNSKATFNTVANTLATGS